MQATPTILSEDPKVFGIRIWDPAGASVWAGQPVTVEARSGKSWTAKVGTLVRTEKDGAVGIYTDARNDAKGIAAPAEDPEVALAAKEYRASGELAELREHLKDMIPVARRTIIQALECLRTEADLSFDDYEQALHTFDVLAGTETEPPFEPVRKSDSGDRTLFRVSPNQIRAMDLDAAQAVIDFHRDHPPTMDYVSEFAASMAEIRLARVRVEELARG